MNRSSEVGLEALANALFTFGLIMIGIGVGLIQTDIGGLKEGATAIGLGLALIAVGIVIYYLKKKLEPVSSGGCGEPEPVIEPECHKANATEEAVKVEERFG